MPVKARPFFVTLPVTLMLCASANAGTIGPARTWRYPVQATRSWMSADTKKAGLVYISDYEHDSVSVFDAKAGTLLGQIGGQSAAAGLYVDKHHRLWVANSGNSQVLVYDRGATTPSLTLLDPSQRPFDTAVCPNGTVYVSNYYSFNTGLGSISVYAKGSTSPTGSLADPNEYQNYFITCDAQGNVFTTLEVAGLASQIDEYPGGAGPAKKIVSVDSSGGIVMDDAGNLVVSDPSAHDHRVYRSWGNNGKRVFDRLDAADLRHRRRTWQQNCAWCKCRRQRPSFSTLDRLPSRDLHDQLRRTHWRRLRPAGENEEQTLMFFPTLFAFAVTSLPPAWQGYANDPQHGAVASAAAQPVSAIHWQMSIDKYPEKSGPNYEHYPAPVITGANTVIVAAKQLTFGYFKIIALRPKSKKVIWNRTSDYVFPPDSTYTRPTLQPFLTKTNKLYYAGIAGTIYERDNPDMPNQPTKQYAFYGLSNYKANPGIYGKAVQINTPLTGDSGGNIFFGYRVSGSNPLGLTGGIGRVDANGNGTWVTAAAASRRFTHDRPANQFRAGDFARRYDAICCGQRRVHRLSARPRRENAPDQV